MSKIKNSLFPFLKPKDSIKIHFKANRVGQKIEETIINNLEQYKSQNDKLIIFCIGSDRSTGDSLGPLVGTKLSKLSLQKTKIIGTLKNPVHAKNIKQQMNNLNKNFPKHFIIAIDASLGKKKNIGHINIKPGPLKPGAGVKKDLPAVGNMQVTGLVNTGGYMEYLVLQSTRLNLVYQMAKVIARSLFCSIKKYNKKYKD